MGNNTPLPKENLHLQEVMNACPSTQKLEQVRLTVFVQPNQCVALSARKRNQLNKGSMCNATAN